MLLTSLFVMCIIDESNEGRKYAVSTDTLDGGIGEEDIYQSAGVARHTVIALLRVWGGY